MKIKLENGQELDALGVRGENIYYQGMSRDCLGIIFDTESYTLAEIDSLFTPENCQSMTLTDDSGSYIHSGYIIRRSLEKSTSDGRTGGTGSGGTTPKEKIIVKMAQISYLEQTQAELMDAVDMLILSGLEG